MKRLFPFAIAALLLSSGHAHAQPGHWRDSSGKPVADTDSRKSRNGFGGALLATTDEDWEKKWSWGVEMVLRDMGRGTELPLRTSFGLK